MHAFNCPPDMLSLQENNNQSQSTLQVMTTTAEYPFYVCCFQFTFKYIKLTGFMIKHY